MIEQLTAAQSFLALAKKEGWGRALASTLDVLMLDVLIPYA